MKAHLAIFASGSGSNALKIIQYFQGHKQAQVSWVMSNKAEAGVLQHASQANIPASVFPGNPQKHLQALQAELEARKITHIILAGFLQKIPERLIQLYPNRIINIHPALLPRYGGKGMYGHHVHEAVIAHGETQSGITIHLVDEVYDHGKILFQKELSIHPEYTPQVLAQKVLEIEHQYYAPVIEQWVQSTI